MTSTSTATGDKRLTGGHTITQWAADVCAGLHVPVTATNLGVFVTWANHESGGYNPSVRGGLNNPLNTTEASVCVAGAAWPNPGSCRNGGSQGNIKDFSTYEQGVAAIVHNLSNQNFGYPAIVAALQKQDAQAAFRAIDASQFGTHGLAGSKPTTVDPNVKLTDIKTPFGTLPFPGPNVNVDPIAGAQAALDVAGTFARLAANLIDPAWWKRVGVFALGALVAWIGFYMITKDTAPVQALDKAVKSAGEAAASAAVLA